MTLSPLLVCAFQEALGLAAQRTQGSTVPVSDPHVTKAIQYLLGRRQEFGGWMDPPQSFENGSVSVAVSGGQRTYCGASTSLTPVHTGGMPGSWSQTRNLVVSICPRLASGSRCFGPMLFRCVLGVHSIAPRAGFPPLLGCDTVLGQRSGAYVLRK